MMKTLAIQKDIVAYLRALGRPETSRALAHRFLRIERGDEETCRRLLTPFLATVPGIEHRPDEGWSLTKSASRSPGAAPAAGIENGAAAEPVPAPRPAGAIGLRDFVALASEGTGPGGSGPVRSVSLLPVLAGEDCQEEHFPARDPDDDAALAEAPPEGGLSREDLEDVVQTIGDLPVVCHRVARELEPIRRLCAERGVAFETQVISAAKLGHLLLGLKTNHAASDLASALRIETRGPDDCRGRVRIVAESFLRLVPLLLERGIDSVETLLEYQDMPAAPLDLSAYAFGPDDLKALPAGPGVYRFLDRRGEVIYVGKAKNLRSRVGSYFTPSARGTAKGMAVLAETHALRFEPVASELEAALLEAALIAEHRPRLNRQFEVHERPAPYGPRLNLVVVLKDTQSGEPDEPACTLHLLRGGRYAGRVSGIGPGAAERAEPWERARRLMTHNFFPETPSRDGAGGLPSPLPAGKEDPGVDIDWQLVGSYLRKHRDEVSVLDIDESSSRQDAEAKLLVLVRACLSGAGRTVAR